METKGCCLCLYKKLKNVNKLDLSFSLVSSTRKKLLKNIKNKHYIKTHYMLQDYFLNERVHLDITKIPKFNLNFLSESLTNLTKLSSLKIEITWNNKLLLETFCLLSILTSSEELSSLDIKIKFDQSGFEKEEKLIEFISSLSSKTKFRLGIISNHDCRSFLDKLTNFLFNKDSLDSLEFDMRNTLEVGSDSTPNFFPNLVTFRILTKISIKTDFNDNTLISFAESLGQLSNLMSIEIIFYFSTISDYAISKLTYELKKIEKLKELKLFPSCSVSNLGITYLASVLKKNKNLKSLDLDISYCKVNTMTLELLLLAISNLFELNSLRFCLECTDLSFIWQHIIKLKNLEKLHIFTGSSDIDISGQFLSNFRSIDYYFENLHDLSLTMYIKPHNSDCIEEFIRGIMSLNKLKNLSLNFKSAYYLNIPISLTSLRNLKDLTYLEIYINNLNINSLTDSLSKLFMLKHLNLNITYLPATTKEIINLFTSIGSLTNLEHLQLKVYYKNEIVDMIIHSISNMINLNNFLLEIDMISDKEIESVKKSISLNKKGINFELRVYGFKNYFEGEVFRLKERWNFLPTFVK
jgi:hypothetical protein